MSAVPQTYARCSTCRKEITFGGGRAVGRFVVCLACIGRFRTVLRMSGRVGIAAFREYVKLRWPALYGDAQALYMLVREAQAREAR